MCNPLNYPEIAGETAGVAQNMCTMYKDCVLFNLAVNGSSVDQRLRSRDYRG